MKININTIPEEGLRLDIDRDDKWFSALCPVSASSEGIILSSIHVTCAVRKIGENIYIEGTIDAKGEIPCSRCIEMTGLFIDAPFNAVFSPAPATMADEMELSTSDLDFEYYKGEIIDLDGVIFEQVMLQIPMKPLCSELCRGLCPHCGANLNKTTCSCRDEDTNGRFAILKQLKLQH